jgi:predicted acyl esterase
MKKLLLLTTIVFSAFTAKAQLNPEPIQIPMRDGKNLSAHLYRPNQQDSFPVILIQKLYNKNFFLPRAIDLNFAYLWNYENLCRHISDWGLL